MDQLFEEKLLLKYEEEGKLMLTGMHFISIPSFLSTALAVYVILWRSTKNMGQYKYFLLNLTVSF